MGMDIFLSTEFLSALIEEDPDAFFAQKHLSRSFYNLMWRRQIITHDPELDQIGRICGVDITPLYDMETYEDLSTSDDERDQVTINGEFYRRDPNFEAFPHKGNINKVYDTVNALIAALSTIGDISSRLQPTDHDTLKPDIYFADLSQENGKDVVYNNFGQDLRTIKTFIEYAKQHGRTTIWFMIG